MSEGNTPREEEEEFGEEYENPDEGDTEEMELSPDNPLFQPIQEQIHAQLMEQYDKLEEETREQIALKNNWCSVIYSSTAAR